MIKTIKSISKIFLEFELDDYIYRGWHKLTDIIESDGFCYVIISNDCEEDNDEYEY